MPRCMAGSGKYVISACHCFRSFSLIPNRRMGRMFNPDRITSFKNGDNDMMKPSESQALKETNT